MKTRKETLTRVILEKIGELGYITLDSFFPKKYGFAHPSRKFFGLDDHPHTTPRTVSSLLSRLRREGLVARKGSPGSYTWALTEKGAGHIKSTPLSIAPADDGVSRLVIFDIPEYERKKRDAIRAELIACNFRMLQKSVWIGTNPLPEDFITLVDELRLKGKLHIFSIRESGTIGEA